MKTDHDSDPDATVRMPRPVPHKDAELEQLDPESTLVRDDWGSVTIPPPQDASTPARQPLATPEAQPEWEKTLRRPSYKSKGDPR